MDSIPAARAGWTEYDELAGPTLDSSLWDPLDLGSGRRLEPGTHTTVEDGAVTIDVLSTGDRVFAEHEVLVVPGQEDPFTRVKTRSSSRVQEALRILTFVAVR